jgi:hypothetical protein
MKFSSIKLGTIIRCEEFIGIVRHIGILIYKDMLFGNSDSIWCEWDIKTLTRTKEPPLIPISIKGTLSYLNFSTQMEIVKRENPTLEEAIVEAIIELEEA